MSSQKISVTNLSKELLKITPRAAVTAFFMSVLYHVCVSFRDNNSFWKFSSSADIFQLFGKIILLTLIVYIVLSGLYLMLLHVPLRNEKVPSVKYRRAFLFISWGFIVICYIPWLLCSYPGSANPDTIVQFQNYFGETSRSMWQPPFSSLLMGLCYSVGKFLVDANFGFFLYQLLQTVVAGFVFSYSMYKLMEMGLRRIFCFIGILFYAVTPIWGGYAQWVEKDFLFAVMIVLEVVMAADILYKKECTPHKGIALCIVSLLCVFLRNNGIHAILPCMIALAFNLKGKFRRNLLIVTATVLIIFESVTRIILPACGIGRPPVSETIGVMFQQTARTVCIYPDDLTEEEISVLEENFRSIDNLKEYQPNINDPVKICYTHAAPKGYFVTWFKMLLRHPQVYVAAYVNGAYGYLAPVKVDMGAYIMQEYPEYLTERLGLYHVFSKDLQMRFLYYLYGSGNAPVIKYLSMPGTYSWIVFICVFEILALGKKKKSLTVFIPALVTIMVCTISPLSCAMRYLIPVALQTPFLIGFTLQLTPERSLP